MIKETEVQVEELDRDKGQILVGCQGENVFLTYN